MEYAKFIESKKLRIRWRAIEPDAISPALFDFQQAIVRRALRTGRFAIWADCGLGKTAMALEWARHVVAHTQGRVLILTPIAVAHQFQSDREKLGIDVPLAIAREAQDVAADGITVTNYERLHRFNPADFNGVVLDESSILKSYDGKTRTAIIESFAQTDFKLALTATPAPNDHMELGNHSEFLGALSRAEMLATFFINDSGDTGTWRLKGHAVESFWEWVSEWAVALNSPADVGFDGSMFVLPSLETEVHVVNNGKVQDGRLFAVEATTLTDQRQARNHSLKDRVAVAANLCNGNDEPWVVWCDLNSESEMLARAIPDAVEVRGSNTIEEKETALRRFQTGDIRVLVIKPSIAGFGVNWQHCARTVFVGPSHSFEQWYQAIRRLYRFGQKRIVECHMILSDSEMPVLRNLKRKQRDAESMSERMIQIAGEMFRRKLEGSCERPSYEPGSKMQLPKWLHSTSRSRTTGLCTKATP